MNKISTARCAIALFAACFMYRLFEKERVESIGDISSSPFGYKLLIPYYGIWAILASSGLFSFLIYIIAMAIGYFVYRRSFKLKMSDVIMLGIAAVIAIAVSVISGITNI